MGLTMRMSGLDVKVPDEFAAGNYIVGNGRAVRLCNSAHYYPNCKSPVHLRKRPQRVLGYYARSSVTCVSPLQFPRWSCCRLPQSPRFTRVSQPQHVGHSFKPTFGGAIRTERRDRNFCTARGDVHDTPGGTLPLLISSQERSEAWITTSGEIMLTSNCRLYSLSLR
jgi:hypothetical protein